MYSKITQAFAANYQSYVNYLLYFCNEDENPVFYDCYHAYLRYFFLSCFTEFEIIQLHLVVKIIRNNCHN